MKAKLIQAHGQIKLRASYTIVVEDGEKVVYVRDGVFSTIRNFEKQRRGAIIENPPNEKQLKDVLDELVACDRLLYTVGEIDENDIINAALLLDLEVVYRRVLSQAQGLWPRLPMARGDPYVQTRGPKGCQGGWRRGCIQSL